MFCLQGKAKVSFSIRKFESQVENIIYRRHSSSLSKNINASDRLQGSSMESSASDDEAR